jgi:hypothetical protein
VGLVGLALGFEESAILAREGDCDAVGAGFDGNFYVEVPVDA